MRYTLQTWDGACLVDGLPLTLADACSWCNRAKVRMPNRSRPKVEVWRDPLATDRITYVVAILD